MCCVQENGVSLLDVFACHHFPLANNKILKIKYIIQSDQNTMRIVQKILSILSMSEKTVFFVFSSCL